LPIAAKVACKIQIFAPDCTVRSTAAAAGSYARTADITHDWCYAYWLAIDCMHDRLIGMGVPWRVCVSVGVCNEWTLLVLSVDGVLLP
jgi:hypothetical protein